MAGSFSPVPADEPWMRLALQLAKRGIGHTSPNPAVGAVLVKNNRCIGKGWHHRAGQPHAEIEALSDARSRGQEPAGATLYVTLEPCSTHGRTGPCTEAILQARIGRVVVAAIDPNPRHRQRGLRLLKRAGISTTSGLLEREATSLNPAFNHWIVNRRPLVTVKAAMTLDGKIADAQGRSKWITGEAARQYSMNLRARSDAILVGVNTVLADDPHLTARTHGGRTAKGSRLRRIILDANARTPQDAAVVRDPFAHLTTIVVSRAAPKAPLAKLEQRVRVVRAPARTGRIDLPWLLDKLGEEEVTSLLVEGGGEVNASFLLGGLAQRIAFFYAPIILGGRDSIKAVGGRGLLRPHDWLRLEQVRWRALGKDLLLTASIASRAP